MLSQRDMARLSQNPYYRAALREYQLGSFSSDARTAMQASPDYFLWRYTVKSVSLGVVAAGLAFMIGRATVKSCR